MLEGIKVAVAEADELPAAQQFYESRGYGGAAIEPTDFVVLAKWRSEIVGIGRLCQEGELLWLRGMQVHPEFQRSGLGTRILAELSREIGGRWCCCLPYGHLISFYRKAGFEAAADNLPLPLAARLASYSSRGLGVVAMIRPRSQSDNSSKMAPLAARLDSGVRRT